ncbi:MAG: lamin tail domain-containing protein [Bacteroidales bacterium]|nr:lamin tail domain-containing protein [Bacteroidales bacterium]
MSFSFSNQGETIFLLDSLKNTIDKVEYNTTEPWPTKANGLGYTLQLNFIDIDNNAETNWNAAQLHGSPGAANTIYSNDEANKNIVINEINYNSHENSNSGDWIEIFNKGTSAIDISGWVVKDASQNIYIVPDNTLITAGAYLVLVQSATQFQLIYPEISNVLNINFGLNSTADEVYLYDKFENLVDFVRFSSAPPWPITANGTGRTIILADINNDNNIAENWSASELLGSPGASNTTTGLIKNIPHFNTNVFPTVSSNTFSLNSEIECTVYLFSEIGVLLDVIECKHEATYNAKNLNNGVYFIYFVNDTFVKSHTILVKK